MTVGDASLQDAFKRFQQKKKTEFKLKYGTCKGSEGPVRTQEQQDALRSKFVETVKKYQGVPYAQRFHKPTCERYQAPQFLDCCGLIRRAMLDLAEDFGFTIERWNQAYMFDTLPDDAATVEEMRPGDLIFYQGTYKNEKLKKQKHNIVHIEMYLGDDVDPASERCVGSRWHKGVVSIFDSFKFPSKSWSVEKIHFKKLDTWLKGQCVSHCPDHDWRSIDSFKKDTKLLRRSIFMDAEDELTMDESVDACAGEMDSDGEAQ